MYEHVLVPTDGSPTVETTLDHAIPIARDNDATVHGLYVVDNRIVTAADSDTRSDLESSLREEGKTAVETVTDRAESAGLEAVGELRKGTPWKEILTYTEEADADLIVIGTRGKSPREKIVSLGSVSERVVDNASTPVFVVRGGE
ncbi:universal stress protein [Halopenitus sp. H-Gu1]|uniref:universal stress protein n=1 Tax=Halopenitus sp. H-Gu1 TaxID=3242697 RepID=UPI00359DE9B0